MKENFPVCLENVLLTEGGFTDNLRDPGGPTNKGITQVVYDNWRLVQGLPKRTVRLINDYEVGKIYKGEYWDACHCDELPKGVDYAVFDFAVNSGDRRSELELQKSVIAAQKHLQRAVSVVEDGVIGPQTLEAVNSLNPSELIEAICDLRIEFMQKLKNYSTFKNGWLARVAKVDKLAKAMAAGQ